MSRIKEFAGRLSIPVVYSLIGFYNYWWAFDGAYTGMDLLWGGLVTGVLAVAVFMYFPIAKKIENYSPAWFLGLLISVNLFVGGWIISDPYFLRLPVVHRAWGEYMFAFGILMPIIHILYRSAGKPREKGAFFKRTRLKDGAESV